MNSLVVLDDYQDVARSSADWHEVEARFDVVFLHEWLRDDAAFAEALADATVVMAMRERTAFDAARLAALPRLRLLVTTGMTNKAVDLSAAAAQGVTVCGTQGMGTETSELALALMLALARDVVAADADVRAGRWQRTVGVRLAGRTLGLVGLGHQGARMAGLGAALGMEVLAWSRHFSVERAAEHGATAVAALDALVEAADVLSIHVPLTSATTGLIDARRLDLLGADGLLVNTSRGPIVDEIALARALTEGRIAGAALDVFGREPLPADHPLMSAPHTILTPHIGYVSAETYRAFYEQCIEDVLAWDRGEPVRLLT